MKTETWVSVNEFVAVSNRGNVRDIATGLPIKQFKDGFGYSGVAGKRFGLQRFTRTHRLVAMAFIPNPTNKPEVNHKDGDPSNNDVDNLEWNTHQENMAHAVRTGLKQHFGEKHHWNKLKEHEVKDIFKMKWVYGLPHRLIARIYGISHQHVSDICRQNRCWKRNEFEFSL